MKSKITKCLPLFFALFLTGCGTSFGSSKTYDVTIHYYDNITRSYSITKGQDTKVAMLAPSGKQIAGIYSSDNLIQSDWKCVINAKNWDDQGYDDLYVEYKDGLTEYSYEDIAYDENPKQVGFYEGGYVIWTIQLNSGTSAQGEFVSSMLCNEYADLGVNANFLGKGDGSAHSNIYKSHIKVGEETLNSFEQATLSLDNSYKSFTYGGLIRPKQLISNSYEIKVYIGARYGYQDYTIKNMFLSFTLSY